MQINKSPTNLYMETPTLARPLQTMTLKEGAPAKARAPAVALTPDPPEFPAGLATVDQLRPSVPGFVTPTRSDESAASSSGNSFFQTPSFSESDSDESLLLTKVKDPTRGQLQGGIESPIYPEDESTSMSSIKDASLSFGSPGASSFSGTSSSEGSSGFTAYNPRPRQTDISKDELSISNTQDIISQIRLNTADAIHALNENLTMLQEMEQRSNGGSRKKKTSENPSKQKEEKQESAKPKKYTPNVNLRVIPRFRDYLNS